MNNKLLYKYLVLKYESTSFGILIGSRRLRMICKKEQGYRLRSINIEELNSIKLYLKWNYL